jgi:hypothetical protein
MSPNSWAQGQAPVIIATWETKIGRSRISKITRDKKDWRYDSTVGMTEFKPQYHKKKKERKQ